ncbi:NACHT domain-containing protein [Frankia sp. AiPs1]|nr:NACHT domain-containing protein [Frankia sp. AiPs1]
MEALRALRENADSPPYRVMESRVHYSRTTLARAVDGRVLPNLDVALAYVRACGGDEAEWETRWHSVRTAQSRASRPGPPGGTAATPSGSAAATENATTDTPRPAQRERSEDSSAPVAAASSPRRLSSGLDEVVDRLATLVRHQWEAEAELRRINDPHPLPVTWSEADPELAEEWALATETLRRAVPAPRLTGGDDQLADIFAAIPTRRLVVLGEPGSGKTILLVRLVLDLLRRRESGGSVPVLVPAASWNPDGRDLRTWLTDRLATDYPGLAGAMPGSRGVCRVDALLDEGLLLPVLDGLDEIPDALRGPAITRINEALRPADGIVVSCREQQFREAVQPGGGAAFTRTPMLLRAACAITLHEVNPASVRTYLRRDADSSADRWRPVFAALGTDAPVARALRTPLMVGLARTIYNPRHGEHRGALPDPAELCDRERFPDARAVENHLFDAFIPAAYRRPPHPRPARSWRRGLTPAATYSVEQAERWLTFLAAHLQRDLAGTTNLAWWEIPRAAPRWLAGAVVGTVAGLAAGFVAALTPQLGAGLGIGMLAALAVALPVRRATGDRRKDRLGLRLAAGYLGGLVGGLLTAAVCTVSVGTSHGMLSGVAGALAVGLAVGPSGGLAGGALGGFVGGCAVRLAVGVGQGPIAGLVDGPAIALGVGLAVGLASRDQPAEKLRWSRAGLLGGSLVGLCVGLGAGLSVGFGVSPRGGLVAGLVAGVSAGAAAGFVAGLGGAPADLTRGASPRTLFARDRTTFTAVTCVVGAAIVVGTALSTGYDVTLGASLAAAVAIALTAGFLQACWGTLAISRVWFALRGHLPWRLMTFLADAHQNRGVLRQAGALYQYRHAELQRRLADRSQVRR